jgi:hypothetical protein
VHALGKVRGEGSMKKGKLDEDRADDR